ncbi:Aste57867_16434 [Aphanomyces stellatus]|uniref:Aste57867_16434 protein n=1 Tax=Aphanomyces stellatus TaxID=120398 RepID=A0A485L5S6_9STRA|nr:hypothetical protein As57867_016377 [Aphanomyces stellatus]VFT93209.1 Aste57867_16434 [Aphanomyces stellatus]
MVYGAKESHMAARTPSDDLKLRRDRPFQPVTRVKRTVSPQTRARVHHMSGGSSWAARRHRKDPLEQQHASLLRMRKQRHTRQDVALVVSSRASPAGTTPLDSDSFLRAIFQGHDDNDAIIAQKGLHSAHLQQLLSLREGSGGGGGPSSKLAPETTKSTPSSTDNNMTTRVNSKPAPVAPNTPSRRLAFDIRSTTASATPSATTSSTTLARYRRLVGMVARKQGLFYVASATANTMTKYCAAVRVQRALRRHQWRRRRRACLVLQRLWRGHCGREVARTARREHLRQWDAATQIQGGVRQWLTARRQHHQATRQGIMCRRIQRMWQRVMVRQGNARQIQNAARRWLASRQKRQEDAKHVAASRLQRWWCSRRRQHAWQQRITRVQAWIRQHAARRAFVVLRRGVVQLQRRHRVNRYSMHDVGAMMVATTDERVAPTEPVEHNERRHVHLLHAHATASHEVEDERGQDALPRVAVLGIAATAAIQTRRVGGWEIAMDRRQGDHVSVNPDVMVSHVDADTFHDESAPAVIVLPSIVHVESSNVDDGGRDENDEARPFQAQAPKRLRHEATILSMSTPWVRDEIQAPDTTPVHSRPPTKDCASPPLRPTTDKPASPCHVTDIGSRETAALATIARFLRRRPQRQPARLGQSATRVQAWARRWLACRVVHARRVAAVVALRQWMVQTAMPVNEGGNVEAPRPTTWHKLYPSKDDAIPAGCRPAPPAFMWQWHPPSECWHATQAHLDTKRTSKG